MSTPPLAGALASLAAIPPSTTGLRPALTYVTYTLTYPSALLAQHDPGHLTLQIST